MNAYELCQRHVVTARRHEELAAAARTMRERNVGCLVVVEPAPGGRGERPIGMLTHRDIVAAVIVGEGDAREIRVDEVMTPVPVTVSAGATIEEALQRMRRAGARRAPVVDERSRLAGILALDDIFDYLADHAPVTPLPVRQVVRPTRSVLG